MASFDFYEFAKQVFDLYAADTSERLCDALKKHPRYAKIAEQLAAFPLNGAFTKDLAADFSAVVEAQGDKSDAASLEAFFLRKERFFAEYVASFPSCAHLPDDARAVLTDALDMMSATAISCYVQSLIDRLGSEIAAEAAAPEKKAKKCASRAPLAADEPAQPLPPEELRAEVERIKAVFAEVGISLTYAGHTQGARVTRYEFTPKAGIRMARIAGYADEIGEALGVFGVRIEAPIPNRTVIGVEIPRTDTDIVRLASLLEGDAFREAESKTTVALGTDLAGEAVLFDVAKAPHTLIAGAVGTGKSVCLNSILISLLEKATPDELRLILIDPKRVEFNVYSRVPHLLMPVIGDTAKAAGALNWAIQEMERRYNLIEAAEMRDIRSYNEYCKGAGLPPLPRLLIVVDELHDLMFSHRKAVESAICRIAQKSRAAGIHLVLATQRPSVTVFTQDIKINIPARIALRVCSYADSRTVLDMSGAERLLPCGDMLFSPMGTPMRMQCAFVSDEEIREAANRAVEAYGTAQFDDAILSGVEREAESVESAIVEEEYVLFQETRRDPKFEQAIDVAFAAGNVSTSLLQRKLGIGFGKAARFIDVMHELGIVGEAVAAARPRELLITREEYEARKAETEE